MKKLIDYSNFTIDGYIISEKGAKDLERFTWGCILVVIIFIIVLFTLLISSLLQNKTL